MLVWVTWQGSGAKNSKRSRDIDGDLSVTKGHKVKKWDAKKSSTCGRRDDSKYLIRNQMIFLTLIVMSSLWKKENMISRKLFSHKAPQGLLCIQRKTGNPESIFPKKIFYSLKTWNYFFAINSPPPLQFKDAWHKIKNFEIRKLIL